ncbi:hypothetical protein D9756_008976 [Leucocoprinus leucothites]|uniref:Uncharacterized protein n=1 Tax=Leucocoprinus leucothites TaxID=201217 RepID=A0A8H5CX77_9AGAR|nr:hypothetical protein D9756_008976 [Leucoagaricus leucothites]
MDYWSGAVTWYKGSLRIVAQKDGKIFFGFFPLAFTGCVAAPLVLWASEKITLLEQLNSGLQATSFFSNVILNIYATLFITIRLFSYRKVVKTLIGGKADTSRYLDIVNILLESAAINVPITIAAAVGIGLGALFGVIITPVAIVGQAFASVIVIHRVAVGRAFNRRQEEELSQLVAQSSVSDNQPKENVSFLEA